MRRASCPLCSMSVNNVAPCWPLATTLSIEMDPVASNAIRAAGSGNFAETSAARSPLVGAAIYKADAINDLVHMGRVRATEMVGAFLVGTLTTHVDGLRESKAACPDPSATRWPTFTDTDLRAYYDAHFPRELRSALTADQLARNLPSFYEGTSVPFMQRFDLVRVSVDAWVLRPELSDLDLMSAALEALVVRVRGSSGPYDAVSSRTGRR